MKETLKKYIPYCGICAAVLAIGLVFVPGFAHYGNNAEMYSGFQAIFYIPQYLQDNTTNGRASVAGIIALILLVLAIPSYVFHKKSSALLLLGGILNTVAGILFLLMDFWFKIIYRGQAVNIDFMTYLIGAMVLIVGGLTIYTAILLLLEEKKNPVKSNKYSYIKNK